VHGAAVVAADIRVHNRDHKRKKRLPLGTRNRRGCDLSLRSFEKEPE